MAYRFISCDFDDTLFPTSHVLTERTKEAVAACAAYGARFVLNTGRALASILPYYRELGLNTPIIACGGAEVYDKDLRLIDSAPLKGETIHALFALAKELGVHSHIYEGENFLYARECEDSRYYASRTGLVGKEVPELAERTDLTSPKFVVVSSEENVRKSMAIFEERFPEYNVVRSMGRYLEVSDPRATKGRAMLFTAEYLGYTPDEIIAIGDSEIDISMLRDAPFSICPSNGMTRAKAAAKMICGHCDEDCVAEILEQYVFRLD